MAHLSPLFYFLVLFAIAIVAGTFGAMLGLGGGVFIVPLLTVPFGLDIHYAVGASIVSVIATSSGSAARYVRDRMTNLRLGMLLEVATTIGAVTGALVSSLLPVAVLFLVFGAVLLYAAVSMLKPLAGGTVTAAPQHHWFPVAGSYYDPAAARTVQYEVRALPVGFVLSSVAGGISGLLGVGGGVLKVPVMDLVMGVPIKAAAATSSFMVGVTAAASAAVYFARGDINPFIAAPVAMGVLVGTRGGTWLARQLPGATVRRIFAIVLLALASQMLLKGVRGG